ncbi:MAG: tyrosine-type recombinase/integrase [Proteobacteria bacterium]|nr:tyrosine-type recombinase/integrase [Pseudomonadota bacterium]NIS68208.1 tyrosine-type recombinase/integrase [Pseudomonadota bacterium]
MAKIRKRGKSYQIDYFDPTGKRVRRSFKKRKDAEAELGKRVSLIAEDRYLEVKKESKVTFDELAEKYIENFRHQRSFDRSKRFFINTLMDRFKGRMLSTITYYECESFRTERQNTLTKAGKLRTASTINKEVNTLRHMLKKGVSWGMMERSPFERGETLHLKENNGRLRYLSEEEIETLLHECPLYLRDIVEVDLLTGMRRGELLSLKWPQIAGGFIYLHETKTDEARQIPVMGDLEAILKRIKRRHWSKGLITEFVFCDDQGKPFSEVKRSFASALKRAGITDFRFHDLRHTFASHYVMRGGSIRGLQKILGHKDISMTMRYSHLSKEFTREEIRVMNGLTRACAG